MTVVMRQVVRKEITQGALARVLRLREEVEGLRAEKVALEAQLEAMEGQIIAGLESGCQVTPGLWKGFPSRWQAEVDYTGYDLATGKVVDDIKKATQPTFRKRLIIF